MMAVDKDDQSLSVFSLKDIEYVANSRGQKSTTEEFTVGATEELEMLVYDKKKVLRVWPIKFHSLKSKMQVAAALLAAKDRYRPSGPRSLKSMSMLGKAKAMVKGAAYSAMESAFEKCFTIISSSPWLRLVSEGSLEQIKDFVRENIRCREIPSAEHLAKRHKWALNGFGHNALHYAVWFGRPLEVLQYLTTAIKINVNDGSLVPPRSLLSCGERSW